MQLCALNMQVYANNMQEICKKYAVRAEVRRSFITTTIRDESQVTPQGRHR